MHSPSASEPKLLFSCTQRLLGRNGRGGRPGEHGAALLCWVSPGEVEAAWRRWPRPQPPLWPALHTHSPTTSSPSYLLDPPAPRPFSQPLHRRALQCTWSDFSPNPTWDAGPPASPALLGPQGTGCLSPLKLSWLSSAHNAPSISHVPSPTPRSPFPAPRPQAWF